MAEAGTGGDNGQGGAPPPPPPALWYAGKTTDAEIIGHIQTKGWDKKPVDEVALAAIQSHRDAEKLIGVPANQMIRLPQDANDANAWKGVWQRLGVPADAKEYDFAGIKTAAGTDMPADLQDFLRAQASNFNVPKDAAKGIAAALVKFQDDKSASEAAEKAANVVTQRDELKKSWGPHWDANMLVAKNAAAALGVSPETVAALESMTGVGYAKVMEMFRSIGSKIGEDKFVGSGGAGGGVMTREQAVAKKAELMNDTAWTERYLKGGSNEVREMTALNVLIVGDDTETSRRR